jgi:hypothetical protein
MLCCSLSASAQQHSYQVYLPQIVVAQRMAQHLSIDVRTQAADATIPFLQQSGASFARAGDVLWPTVEATPGHYSWEALADFEANVRRIRAAGVEPTAVLQRTPLWATAVDGRVCAGPRADAIGAFERFAEQTARRYASGEYAVRVWQIGNEVDFRPDQISDELGSGCWATAEAPYYGGDYYGVVLARVAQAIRRGNPNAYIVAGGLAHFWPDDTQTLGFLRGMLAMNAGNTFDALSYTGYGVWGANDRLVRKAQHLRAVLAEFGLGTMPLIAAEVGLTCTGQNECPSDFVHIQTEYASRVFAEAVMWKIDTVAWYTLSLPGADPYWHSLITTADGGVLPTPAFYALRNSLRLLEQAQPLGPPPELPDDAGAGNHVLGFQTPRGLLYVVWNQQSQALPAWIPVMPGAQVVCIDQLGLAEPRVADCSSQVHDGLLFVEPGDTRYIEVFAP